MVFHSQCVDELLSTTRAVRKRLDFSRPVPCDLVLDCIRISQQSPTGSNRQTWRWLVVTDDERKAALAEIYRSVATDYFTQSKKVAREAGDVQTVRVYDSAEYLADNLERAPVLAVPCLLGRPPSDGSNPGGFFASIYPAIWSFCLAARARGLGTTLTTLHLRREAEAAELLGIPTDVTQAALLPVAYTLGDEFRPSQRPAAESITFFDRWGDA
jgi:nitroreductase